MSTTGISSLVTPTECWLEGPCDIRYFTETYLVPNPLAVVVFAHGVGEYCGRYRHALGALASRRIACFAWDQYGYGRTSLHPDATPGTGLATHTPHRVFMEGLEWAIRHAKSLDGCGDVPVFLCGQSAGGAFALSFCTRPEGVEVPSKETISLLSGVIALSPAIENKWSKHTWLLGVARQLACYFPNIQLSSGIKGKDLTHDPEIARAADSDDPYFKQTVSIGTMVDVFENSEDVVTKKYALNWPKDLPVLLFHGEADYVTLQSGTRGFYNLVPIEDKTLKTCPNGLHELLNEPEYKDGIIALIGDWILDHAKGNHRS